MASVLGDDDLWCLDDTMSDFRTVSGRVALAQALVRRWITERGELLDDPSYGTDLTDFLNSATYWSFVPTIARSGRTTA